MTRLILRLVRVVDADRASVMEMRWALRALGRVCAR